MEWDTTVRNANDRCRPIRNLSSNCMHQPGGEIMLTSAKFVNRSIDSTQQKEGLGLAAGQGNGKVTREGFLHRYQLTASSNAFWPFKMHHVPQLHTRAFKCELRLTWLGCCECSCSVRDFSTVASLTLIVRRQLMKWNHNLHAAKNYSELAMHIASAGDL